MVKLSHKMLKSKIAEQNWTQLVLAEKQFGWKLITAANMKEMFFEMVTTMTMSYSFHTRQVMGAGSHIKEWASIAESALLVGPSWTVCLSRLPI